LSEYAQSAILASRDYDALKEAFLNSRTAKRLIELGYEEDVKYCCQKNISDNVAIYNNDELTLYI
jgi:2-phosphosulfolactate phosphatase